MTCSPATMADALIAIAIAVGAVGCFWAAAWGFVQGGRDG